MSLRSVLPMGSGSADGEVKHREFVVHVLPCCYRDVGIGQTKWGDAFTLHCFHHQVLGFREALRQCSGGEKTSAMDVRG